MKKILFLFFTLTVSSFTYSQITSFNNLPITRVMLFNICEYQSLDNALIVPEGKIWYVQYIQDNTKFRFEVNGVYVGSMRVEKGAVLNEGIKIFGINQYCNSLNIIEYDLEAQTISLNTNDIKLDGKIKLFPNPTNSMLSLNSDKDYNIEVFDLNGRKIMEVEGNNLDMSNLSKATYIVKAFDKASKETYSYKVVRN